MTLIGDAQAPAPSEERPAKASSPTGAAALAAVVVGALAAALYRQGAFYPVDAFSVAVVAALLAIAALARNRDRHSLAVSVTFGCLAVWWLVRAIMEGSPAAFLPLGASTLAFPAAYLVMRSVPAPDRWRVARR